MSKQTKPIIVFVRGIWADGSSFSKLIPALQAGEWTGFAPDRANDLAKSF